MSSQASEDVPTSGQEAATEASIGEWVSQLDDDHYDARQRAQLKLEQLGQPALAEVVESAGSGSLESVTRAVAILLHWSEGEDQELRVKALENLANLKNRPREAAMAARVLADAREAAALETLSQLGAEFDRDVRSNSLNNLQVFIGSTWKGGSEGLKHLADVPRATTISLLAAPVDDSALEHLGKLPNVGRIEIYSTQVSRDAAKDFDKRFPNIFVDFRYGALLGVRGMPQGQGTINQVEPDSAADKAGIKAGDRITEFNGEQVADFEELTEKISEHRPGEAATLTVVRDEKARQVKVTFGDWGKTQMNRLKPRNRLQVAPNLNPIIQQNQRIKLKPVPAKAAPAK